MTQFTIEHLTRKDDTAPKVRSPPSDQRKPFLSAMDIIQSSHQPFQPRPWVVSDADSEGRSRPTSSESDVSPSTSPPEKPSSTLPPTTPSPKAAGKPEDASPAASGGERQKPPHSYIALIAMAILNSSPKRLLLCDIYEYIMENYPYFRNNERSWRNSIRHNLSLNECFIKAGRSDDGRGHFWAIHPANVEDFARGDFRRRRARRRVRSDYDMLLYPGYQGYQYYPAAIPTSLSGHPAMPTPLAGHFGYVPMTYSPLTSVFPAGGVTPYIAPRLPPHPAAMLSGYVPAAATGTVPSVSSPSLASTVVSTSCTAAACTPSTSRQSPPSCSSPSCSPPATTQHRPLFAPPVVKHPSTLMTPYAQQPWTPYTRGFHPYLQ